MTATIDQKKLEKLKEALIADPDLPDAGVKKIIGKDAVEDDYYAALTAQWPDLFPAEEADAVPEPAAAAPAKRPAPVAAKNAPAPFNKQVFLRHPDGSTTSYRVARETEKAIFIEELVPKDLVTVTLGGQSVELDVNELKAMSGNATLHGRPVAALLQLAELSR